MQLPFNIGCLLTIAGDSGEAYGLCDCTGWGEGPWLYEPDLVVFSHYGFWCVIRRHSSHGSLLGYVRIPFGHLWYEEEKPYFSLSLIHGGITYTGHGDYEDKLTWWVGFDAAHSTDLVPALPTLGLKSNYGGWATYKTPLYMKQHCEALARSAKGAILK